MAKITRPIIDTDVMIDYLRGNAKAKAFLDGLLGDTDVETVYLSAVTVAELYAGVRKHEEAALATAIGACDVLSVDLGIARDGGFIARDNYKVHGTGLMDAVIADTAIKHGLTLVTRNDRHFPMVVNKVVPYTLP